MAITHTTPADGSFTVAGTTAWNEDHTIAAGTITTTELGGDITAAGKALLDDANAAAQIATLGLDADLATFALPANTTISVFGASLVDDAAASNALTTLGLDGDLATFAVPANTTISAFGATLVDDAAASNAATTLGLGTGDSPQFTAVNIGHASNTTVSQSAPGDIAVEGNIVYRAGGTDVPVADGGTEASDAQTARENLGVSRTMLTATGSATNNLSDNATYYGGASSLLNGQVDWGRIYFRAAVRIKQVRHEIFVAGTLATGEGATTFIRVDGTTNNLVTTGIQFSSTGPLRYDNPNLDIAIAASSYVQILLQTTTFSTNPTTVINGFSIVYV